MPSDQTTPVEPDVAEIIEIRDPEVDVEAIMARVRENVARRRAQGAYQEDLDAIAQQVLTSVLEPAPTAPVTENASDSLGAALAELNARCMVREVPFTSRAPAIGPLIVAVRNFWNWMSTKWYVLAIVQQIVAFHVAVVTAFNELASAQRALDEEVRQLKALSQQQQGAIAALQEELARLQASDLPARK